MNLNDLKDAYRGKRIFLTGHTGFKGTWMLAVLRFLEAGAVMGYALDPEGQTNMYGLIGGDDLCESVIGDIRDRERLEKALLEFQPDFVFHLAAQSLVRRSYVQPAETYEVNVMGTAYLLDAIRRLEKPCRVVCITTDKVYENREWWYPYREDDHLGGYDPYSSGKACAEIAAASWRSSFFNPDRYAEHGKAIATARAGNVIGGGDWAEDRIIPDLVRALEAGRPLEVRNPNAVRPWQHVLEPVCGYLWLAHMMGEAPHDYATAYNFGPWTEDNLSVRALVEKCLEIWEGGQYIERPDPHAPHEAKLLRLDISKAVNELDWKPRWHAAHTLDVTLHWYRHYRKDPLGLTLEQVKAYLQ